MKLFHSDAIIGHVCKGFYSLQTSHFYRSELIHTWTTLPSFAGSFLLHFTVKGNSMEGATIKDGSILVVDRSKNVKNENIIIANLNGDFTVKRYRKLKGQVWLIPEHPAYDDVLVTEEMEFQIWGVVTFIINQP
jgi:SOS-response transcriptional repressor LexA